MMIKCFILLLSLGLSTASKDNQALQTKDLYFKLEPNFSYEELRKFGR